MVSCLNFLFCSLLCVDFWFSKEFGKVETACVGWTGGTLGLTTCGLGWVCLGVSVHRYSRAKVLGMEGAALPAACLRSLTITVHQGSVVAMVGSGSILQVF